MTVLLECFDCLPIIYDITIHYFLGALPFKVRGAVASPALTSQFSRCVTTSKQNIHTYINYIRNYDSASVILVRSYVDDTIKFYMSQLSKNFDCGASFA